MKSNEYDLETILQKAFEDVVPGAFDDTTPISIRRDESLVPSYLKVEKDFKPIPWIDTKQALFIEISPLVLTQPEVIVTEAKRLKEAHFPGEDILAALNVCISIGKRERAAGYERTESFLLSSIPESIDHGMMVTTMDHSGESIYSLSSDIPANLSRRYRETHIKSIVISLIKKLPRDFAFSLISYDYELFDSVKLNLFISLK